MQITVTFPCDFQLFQRSAQDRAVIPVRVEGADPGRRLVARLRLADDAAWRGQSTDWSALDEQGGQHVGRLEVPAGGWYRLEVGEPGGPTLATVPRVGVGELFLVAGQSNAANFGEPALQARDARVATTDGVIWRHGDDPMQGTHGNGGGSPWPVLGDLLARSLQMPVAFLDVAQGGSHTWEWLPATDRYYPRLVTAGQRLGPGGARALLWDQGQSDAIGGSSLGVPVPAEAGITNEPEAVYDRMVTVIRQLNSDLGWRLPWVVANAGYLPQALVPGDYAAGRLGMKQVCEGQRLLWTRGMALQGPDNDDLTGPTYRADQDGLWIHFNELGLRVVAERWFALLWAQLYALLPLALPRR